MLISSGFLMRCHKCWTGAVLWHRESQAKAGIRSENRHSCIWTGVVSGQGFRAVSRQGIYPDRNSDLYPDSGSELYSDRGPEL